MRTIPLFKILEIETSSLCNRSCSFCIRNSHPDKEAVSSWFTQNYLPFDTIKELCKQALALGFQGTVNLQHYNEPLLDERFVDIAKYVKSLSFSNVAVCTNADLLTEELAEELDGVLTSMTIALYSPNNREKRTEQIRSWFSKTYLNFTGGEVIPTHYGSQQTFPDNICYQPLMRFILNHRSQMLLCCDDVIGNFDLGTFPEKSLAELWWSDWHQELVLELLKVGGRKIHPHCLNCPRQ